MKSVVICGSSRFKPEMKEFAKKLTELGAVVYEPYLYSNPDEWGKLTDEQREFVALGLTHDHFYKIRMADIVLVFNKDGYVGNSTTLEIGYAIAANKPIYALSDKDEEICRHVLFRSFISSPEELSKVL